MDASTRSRSQADLNALRSQPPQTAIARPQPLKPRPFNLKLDDLLAQAEARPQLEALKALIAKQEKAVDLAKKDYYPDITVGLAYGFRETLDPPGEPETGGHVHRPASCSICPSGRAPRSSPGSGRRWNARPRPKRPTKSFWDQLAAAIKDRYAKLQRLAPADHPL